MYTNFKSMLQRCGVGLMLLTGLVWTPVVDAATNEMAATNETVVSTNSVAVDLKIDKELKALNPPVLQPVLYPPDDTKGAPVWPLYKEQPPAAQQDFQPPKPAELPKARVEEQPRSEPDSDPDPQPTPSLPPQPPPAPCTPNSPNWPNCLNGP